MKKVKITTIILAIILIVLVAFGGVYIKEQNRMEDKVKEYSFGRELAGERLIELKVSDGTTDEKTKNAEEDLTVENYEIVKKTIEKRLKSLNAQDYTISLNKENGVIRVELPEDDKTDDYAYYLIASGKVSIKEKDTSTELLNEKIIKKDQYTYTSNTDGAYQVYLEISLTEDGQAKIEEIQNNYAILKDDVDAVDSSKSSDESTDTTDETNAETTDTENTENAENAEETPAEETKKVAKLSIAGTEYDVDKIEKNKIRVKIGSQTSNTTTVNNSMAKAAELTMLINSGKYPINYEVQNNRFVHSDITNQQLLYFAGAVAIILLVLFVILIIKYKSKGLLTSISCVGFIALLSLVLRYTNVIISIEGIGAVILVILIDLKLSQMILNKTKIIDVVSEAVTSSYKELFLKLIPIMIIAIVFCFSGWTNLSSFGMIMFWGFVLIAVYNIIVTKTLLKLKENK